MEAKARGRITKMKTILITGGSDSLGKTIAAKLASYDKAALAEVIFSEAAS